MTEEVKKFLERLKKVSTKAIEEKTAPKVVYERARKGIYEMISIDDIFFIVEPEKEETK